MSVFFSRFGVSPRLLAGLLSLFGAANLASAEIIYRENFPGAGNDPLAGRPPGIRSGTQGGSSTAIWAGPDHSQGSRVFADGTMEMPSVDFEGASAFLPFTVTAGVAYKLSLSGVSVRSGDWTGAGFLAAEPAPSGDKRFRDNNPVFWSLLRRVGSTLTDQTFSGPAITGAANTDVTSSSSLTILLDATSTTRWSVKWFYDGRLVRSGTFAPLPIGFVGFGFNTTAGVPAGSSTISFFALEALDASADADDDGLPDKWEAVNFRVSEEEAMSNLITKQNGSADTDGDGYTNLEEFVAASDPTNPRSTPLDGDADGLADAWEIHFFGSSSAPFANPAADPDRDGFSNLQENSGRSDPRNADSKPAPQAPAAAKPSVIAEVARNGNDVFLAWSLPPGLSRPVEILRNDRPVQEGSTRLATVPPPTSVYLDQVPSENASYWYWLVVPNTDGVPVSYGPYTTKAAVVWQP